MRALPHAALCLLLVIAGFDALAQNPPAANAKPAEQKPSAATTDAKKARRRKKIGRYQNHRRQAGCEGGCEDGHQDRPKSGSQGR